MDDVVNFQGSYLKRLLCFRFKLKATEAVFLSGSRRCGTLEYSNKKKEKNFLEAVEDSR